MARVCFLTQSLTVSTTFPHVFNVIYKLYFAGALAKSVPQSRLLCWNMHACTFICTLLLLALSRIFLSTHSNNFELYQNTPNPFRGETVIGFNMPTEGAATLSVQDVSGKVIMVANQDCEKGYNQFVVDGAKLPSTGVLYYTLSTDDVTATRKMIMVK